MPALNKDILSEIFIALVDSTSPNPDEEFIKFLLAGKNPFIVGLKFLQKSNKISIQSDDLVVYGEFATNKCICIPFDSPLFKIIFSLISFSISEFFISFNPNKLFLKSLGMEALIFSQKNSKQKLLLPKRIKKLFKYVTNEVYETPIFYNVKKLEIQENPYQYTPEKFNVESMKLISLYISQNFPQLKLLNIKIRLVFDSSEIIKNLFQDLQKINSTHFKKIATTVKGKINFQGSFKIPNHLNINMIKDVIKDENFKIYEWEYTTCVTKNIAIHDELDLLITIYFDNITSDDYYNKYGGK